MMTLNFYSTCFYVQCWDYRYALLCLLYVAQTQGVRHAKQLLHHMSYMTRFSNVFFIQHLLILYLFPLG